MFERDKNELRELGVPLESGRHAIDTADGYRIARQDYELRRDRPGVRRGGRGGAGRAAVGVAGAGRARARRAGEAPRGGRRGRRGPGPGAAAGARWSSPRSGRCWPPCRPGARSRSTTGAAARRARSRGAPSSRGAWCPGGAGGTWSGTTATGTAPRSFRVSRIVGPVRAIGPSGVVAVPSDVDLLAMVRGGVEPAAGGRHGAGVGGRGAGVRVAPPRSGRGAAPVRGSPGEEIELELRSLDTVARWLAGHGADIAVLGPPALAERVRANWEAAAAAHAGATPAARREPAPTCFLPRRRHVRSRRDPSRGGGVNPADVLLPAEAA